MPEKDRQVSVTHNDGLVLNHTVSITLTADKAYTEIFDYPLNYIMGGRSANEVIKQAVKIQVTDGVIENIDGDTKLNVTDDATLITYTPGASYDSVSKAAISYSKLAK